MNLPVQRLVLVLHLFERFHGLVAARLGLSFGGEFGFLALVTRFPFRLGLDEPALLYRGSGSRAEHERKQGAGQEAARQHHACFIVGVQGGVSGFTLVRLYAGYLSHSPVLFDSKNCRSGAWSSAKKEIRFCLLK